MVQGDLEAHGPTAMKPVESMDLTHSMESRKSMDSVESVAVIDHEDFMASMDSMNSPITLNHQWLPLKQGNEWIHAISGIHRSH